LHVGNANNIIVFMFTFLSVRVLISVTALSDFSS